MITSLINHNFELSRKLLENFLITKNSLTKKHDRIIDQANKMLNKQIKWFSANIDFSIDIRNSNIVSF